MAENMSKCPPAGELECVELAAHVLGMEDKYEDWPEVWDRLYDEHGIDEEGFQWLINRLLPLIKVGGMLPDDQMYKGFAKHLGGDLEVYLAKTDYGMTLGRFKKAIAFEWVYDQIKELDGAFQVTIRRNDKDPIRVTGEQIEEGEVSE